MGLGYLGAALFVGQGTPVVDPPPLLLSARVATRAWYVVQVSHILDTTMASLDEDPTLKFHWAETVWLSMWLAAGNASYKVDLLTRLYQQAGPVRGCEARTLMLPTPLVLDTKPLCQV